MPISHPGKNVPPARSAHGRFAGMLRQPGDGLRLAGWLLVSAMIVGFRWWIAVHFPAYIWTRDSGSYLAPAMDWLRGERWVTSARRGPVYSLFIAVIARSGGDLATVARIQQIIGACTAGLMIAMARRWLGRDAFWPLIFCAGWFALFGLPLELECLIRNESLLLLFSTVTLGGWLFILRTGSPAWSATCGLFGGLLQLLKGIFPILPLLILATIIWQWRARPGKAVLLCACYLVCLAGLPATSALYTRVSGTGKPAEPEAGEMFYGRTAQWTYLEGGMVPDIKVRIRGQVEAYILKTRTTGKMDNNEIVKRTVVPTLKQILVNERHLQPADVNRLCWRLGFEAAAHHPGSFLWQVIRDVCTLHFVTAHRMAFFRPEELPESLKDATSFATTHYDAGNALAQRIFGLNNLAITVNATKTTTSPLQMFSRFLRKIAMWRLLSPVFVTSLLLPVLIRYSQNPDCLYWSGIAILWYFYLALLASVGRPLDRYLLPVAPIVFWAYATGLSMLWNRWLRRTMPAPASAEAAI